MKKIINIWVRTTSIYTKILPFLICLILYLVVMLHLEPMYINYLEDFPYCNVQLVYLTIGIATLFGYLLSMSRVLNEAIKQNYQFSYWLILSKREFYMYLFMDKVYYYYIYMIIMFLLNNRLLESKPLLFLIFSVIYICVTYYIYMQKYNNIFRKNKKIRGSTQRFPDYSHLHLFTKLPNIELIFLGFLYRYASIEGLFCKIIVVGLGLFIPTQNFSDNIAFYIFFALFFILTFIDDNFWKSEVKNTLLLKSMGISFPKYSLLNILSGTLFHSVLLSFIYGFKTQNLLGAMLFLLITLFFVCYWTSVYLYVYLSEIAASDIIKQLFLFIMLITEFIPLINIFILLYLLKKSANSWRRL